MKKRKSILWLLLIVAVLVIAGFLFNEKLQDVFGHLKVKHIELVKLPSNRLRFEVNVTASQACDAVIQYWVAGSRDTLYTAVSTSKQIHKLYITNTAAKTDYQFRVRVKNKRGNAISKQYPLETQPIYQATPYFTLEYSDSAISGELKDKYFITQILSEPGSIVIIDHTGEIVWYEPFLKGVKVSHWTKDKTILAIVGPEKIPSSGGDEIIEMGLDGKVITHLKKGEGDMDKLVHHEVRKDRDGNIYALTFTKKITDLSSVKGLKQDTLNGDGIVLFNKAGKKIWEWSVLDHLDPLKDPEILKHKKDWVHGNAVFRLENGDFLISFRDLNQVWLVENNTGRVIWKLGENGDFKLDAKWIFSAQHYIHPTQGQQYMLLDNGERHRISRAMIFSLDTSMRVANPVNIVTLPEEYYTSAKGSAALFGNRQDMVLFCLTDPRAFLITDMKGKILWKVQVGGDPYRLEAISGFSHKNPGF